MTGGRLNIINTIRLGETTSNQTSLVTCDNMQNWVSNPSISPTFWSLNFIINLYFACYHDIMFRINTFITLENGGVNYK